MTHLETLRTLPTRARRVPDACQTRCCRKHAPRAIHKMPVKITFAYVSYPHKAQAEEGILAMEPNEGFIGARPDALQALARLFFTTAE